MARISKTEEFSTTEESKMDWKLFGITLAIICVGLINVHSASQSMEVAAGGFSYDMKQLINVLIGLSAMAVVMFIDYRLIERIAYILFGINLFLLALTEIPGIGEVRYGARRWIDFGFFSYQPSESMKLLVVLALSKYFHYADTTQSLDFRDLWKPLLFVVVPGVLTIIQPDLGTGSHLMIGGLSIILFVGIRPRVLMTFLAIAAVGGPLMYKFGMKPYQQDRIKTFLDPMSDPKGDGYNAIQSMYAVGSGQVTGKGFLKGTQTQLDFTPEGHTDFIFTVLAEEWGFIGALFLLFLFLLFFNRAIEIASSAKDKFGSLTCVGIIGLLVSQIVINISMVTGLFPIVGIPLPFVSFGGTSMLTVCIATGLLLNINYRKTLF